MTKLCIQCTDDIPAARYALGYKTCLSCGERSAKARKHTVVPLSKSNYIAVSNPEILKQLNKYTR